jgi:co-chaperonin GroES (HSP10)
MIQPRNSLVVVKLIHKEEQKIGKLVLPDSFEKMYTEAEVIAVGPGSVSAQGGRSETFDLKPGQRVFIQYRRQSGQHQFQDTGVKYVQNGEVYYLYLESAIVGILGESDLLPDQCPNFGDLVHPN